MPAVESEGDGSSEPTLSWRRLFAVGTASSLAARFSGRAASAVPSGAGLPPPPPPLTLRWNFFMKLFCLAAKSGLRERVTRDRDVLPAPGVPAWVL